MRWLRYMHICYKCAYVGTYDEMSVCMNVSGRYFKCIITKFKQTLSAHLYTHICMYVLYIYILQIVISTHTVFHCCTLHERMYIWGYFLYWLYGVSYFITVFFMQRFWIRLLTKWNRSSQRGITNVFFLQAAIWKVNTVTYTRPFYFAILSSFLVCQQSYYHNIL